MRRSGVRRSRVEEGEVLRDAVSECIYLFLGLWITPDYSII
jgi:hypothetical protein